MRKTRLNIEDRTSGDSKWPIFMTMNTTNFEFGVFPNKAMSSSQKVLSSQTGEDLSWAYSAHFLAKMDMAFREIENGEFDSIDTIDELIDLLDGREK